MGEMGLLGLLGETHQWRVSTGGMLRETQYDYVSTAWLIYETPHAALLASLQCFDGTKDGQIDRLYRWNKNKQT